jgi:hypothetical protein
LTTPNDPVASGGIGLARRLLRGLLRGLGVLLILICAALALILHDLDARVRAALLVQAAELERAIGRAVTLGAVHVAVGRTAEIVLDDVAIAGAAGATGPLAEPLLRVPTIRLGVRLAPLVRSWGTVIEVTRFEVEGPEITLVRTADGLSIDDVRARVAAAPPRPPPASRPQIALDHLAITGAKVHLRAADGAAGGDLDVDPVTLRGDDVRPDAASRLTLTAAMAPGASLDVGLDFAPPEEDPEAHASTLQKIVIRGAGVRLAPILAWLRAREPPALALALALDLADAELGLDVGVTLAPLVGASGKVTIARARFAAVNKAGERTLGAPVDLGLGISATLSADRGSRLAGSFDLAIGAAHARGTAELHDLDSAPVLDLVKLDAAGDAEAILAALPAGVWPRGVAVAGPFTLALRGGQGADFKHGTVKLELHEIKAIDVDAAGHEQAGAPAALGLDAAIFLRESTGALHVSEAELRVGDLVVRGEARAHDLATDPAIDALTISAGGPVERLLELAPPARRRAGVALRGPFAATLAAHGKRGDLAGRITVDLDPASLRAPGLEKPAGTRLGLDVEGRVTSLVELSRATLGLGPLLLSARGKVSSAERLDLAFDWREAALGPLLALFPEASTRFAGITLNGNLAGSGTLSRAGGKTEVATKLSLRGALIRRGALALLGGTDATVSVMTTGDKVSARIAADLGAATLGVAPVFSKAAGRPAHLAFTIVSARDGSHASVLDAQLALPGATIDGLALEIEPHHAHVTVADAALALGPLAASIPLLGAVVPPTLATATAHFSLDFSGDPDDLASATLHVGGLSAASGPARLAGSIDVEGLRPVRAIRVAITDGALDLDALGLAAPAGGAGPARAAARATAISARVHLDTVRARGATLHPLDAELGVERGRVTVKSLHTGVFGGAIDVDKTWIDLGGAAPEVELHARIDGVDLAQLGASPDVELRGRASGQIDLHGAGDGRAALTRSLLGSVRLALRDVHARRAFTRKVTVVNPILGEIFAQAAKKSAGKTRLIELREASGRFDVGSNRLTTSEPFVVRSDDLTASVRGTIGFDQALALEGQLSLAPRAIAAATEGTLVPVRPIPLQLRVSGDASAISLEILELSESVLALRGAVRNGLAGGVAAPLP